MIKEGYIDTCILGAYYCSELLSNKAEELITSIEKPIISLLTEVEFLSVLSKKFRKKELTKKATREIISIYSEHVKEGYYKKIVLTSEHFFYARDLLNSLNYSLHSLDSLHLAIATLQKVPLITSDMNLAKVAKKVKTPVLLLD